MNSSTSYKLCVNCGKKMFGASEGMKFCSPDCITNFIQGKYKKTEKTKNKEIKDTENKKSKEQIQEIINNKTYLLKCKNCGSEFQTVDKKAKYCSTGCLTEQLDNRKLNVKKNESGNEIVKYAKENEELNNKMNFARKTSEINNIIDNKDYSLEFKCDNQNLQEVKDKDGITIQPQISYIVYCNDEKYMLIYKNEKTIVLFNGNKTLVLTNQEFNDGNFNKENTNFKIRIFIEKEKIHNTLENSNDDFSSLAEELFNNLDNIII